jgi:hypothetical protein
MQFLRYGSAPQLQEIRRRLEVLWQLPVLPMNLHELILADDFGLLFFEFEPNSM